MDWQLTVLLLIVGLLIIGFIYFDAKRRQKVRREKRDHHLFEQVVDDGSRDGGGFDIDGISEVRLVESAKEKAEQQSAAIRQVEVESPIEEKPTEEHLEPSFGKSEPASEAAELDVFSEEKIPVLDDPLFSFDKDNLKKSPVKQEPKIEQPTQVSLFEDSSTDENKAADKKEIPVEPELIFTLYLVSPPDAPFQGEALVQALLEQGMRHGEMDIFHRHSQSTGRGPIQFSLANAYDPGTFNLDQLDRLETKGLAIFMTLPGPKKPMKAYDLMVKTSKALAESLGGFVIDSSKAHFSRQIEQHHQAQIQEFERQLLLKQS